MPDTRVMSDAQMTAAGDVDDVTHDDHDAGHGATTSEPLGPVDVTAWAYALVSGAVGLILALAMFIAGGG